MSRPTIIRAALFMATVVAIWGVLGLGSGAGDPELELGQPAPITYIAEQAARVVDEVATEAARQEARDAVQPILERDSQTEANVSGFISAVFEAAEELVLAEPLPDSGYARPELPEVEDTDDQPSGPFVVTGRVFFDMDADGVFEPEAEGERVDRGAGRIRVRVETAESVIETRTTPDGTFTLEVPSPAVVVFVDGAETTVPSGWTSIPETFAHAVVCQPDSACVAPDIALEPNLRPTADVAGELETMFPLPPATVAYLAATAAEDVIRTALAQPEHLGTVLQVAVTRAYQEFSQGIESGQLPEAQNRVRTTPLPVFHSDGTGQDIEGAEAAAEIVATYLQPNLGIDREATELAQEAEALAIVPVEVRFVVGETIVNVGTQLTALHVAAIDASRGPLGPQPASVALLAVIAAMVGVIGMYLSRFRTEIWSRPRMVALLGIILLLAATSIRATAALHESTSWYVLPAVAFGFVTAVLFDQRIALLIALAVGVLTAVGTVDVGITVYAVLAAMAPIPFVSAVSSRGAFRSAVVYSSLAAAAIAAATSSFFHVGLNGDIAEVVLQAVMWAFAASAVASLVGLAALQFFESAFDVTTTLGLLDLTDRNHEALQLLQEEAFGTFNHSLMVGTLADAASRAIGANPLLSRAMAYYHDLGKTENPTYFIENQFGMQNPHDSLDPKESAEIIRSHVTAGVALARRFKIPTEVTQGIVSHHGDGVMRFFYEKARAQSGEEVDIDDFRHIGHKPRTAETAILMLADSLEAACRAVFQTEEPTPDAIEKVVTRIIDEKIEDGQLAESPLTLAELTQIRKAFLDSLVGHYHQRIAYPNFPGS